jgi:hypothetical protein
MSGGAVVVVTVEPEWRLRTTVVPFAVVVVVGVADKTGDVTVGDDVCVVVVVEPLVVVVAAVVVVVAGGVTALQVEVVMVLSSSVTAPLRASARPCKVAPVFIEIDESARIVPTKELDVSSVAELPTCQKTLHARTPPERTTLLAGFAVNVLTA